MPDEVSREAERYGTELARLFAETGQTQVSLAKAVPSSEAAVSRYLAGRRTAPQEFLEAFATFVRGCGVALSEEQFAHLVELRKQAQRASNGAATRVLYWQELTDQLKAEVDSLRKRLGQARDEMAARELEAQLLTAAREEAAGLAAQLTAVEAALSEARTRAEAAEVDRDRLAEKAAGQQDRLEHAVAYSRELERDLLGVEERVKTLQHELQVLQRQVQRLLDEQAGPVPGPGNLSAAVPVSVAAPAAVPARPGAPSAMVSVPMPDWQPSPVMPQLPERRYPGLWSHGDPLLPIQRNRLVLLRNTWKECKRDIRATRRRLRVPFHVRAPKPTTDWLHHSTGDSRWLTIGALIEELQHYGVAYAPRGVADPYALLAYPPLYELTMDAVSAYRRSVTQLRADLNKLTDLHAERQG
ncbi:hypothetical protein E3E14_21395 [Streptomyces sp. ICN441]|uniref:helix-turn-helix domain-containing protein n=1 Tax=Streptomyces sp. ICN441 TaxID=2558286 RepID=UPI00106C5D4D|nr:helix-turn-helix domain-containing protein [Streptomyces sp. ICN441]TFE47357.1 hypothetical protein E3E14_21395 [Streptomyces sp. ICN441]